MEIQIYCEGYCETFHKDSCDLNDGNFFLLIPYSRMFWVWSHLALRQRRLHPLS